jgi:hypothetical protein
VFPSEGGCQLCEEWKKMKKKEREGERKRNSELVFSYVRSCIIFQSSSTLLARR